MTANRTASFFARLQSEEPDADLLRRFVSSRDSSAFEVLVRRHGSLVFAICRRVIGQTQDAEDAFQAVFLVLAQNASKIREPHLLQSWLYGVAVRVAKKAKRRHGRRRELPEANMPEPSFTPTEQQADLWPVIDEELAALSELHRQAILLCDVQQLSRTEAAAKLGIPEGTLSSRLAKGRKLLAERLTKRGVVLSLPMLAGVANAAVPEALIQHALETATVWAGGGLVGSSIVELTREGMTMMTKLFVMCGGVLTATVLGVGLAGDPTKPVEKPKPDAKPAATVADVAKPEAKIGPPRQRGIVEIYPTLQEIHWSPDGKRILLSQLRASRSIAKVFEITETGLTSSMKQNYDTVSGYVIGLHPKEPLGVITHFSEWEGINARNQIVVQQLRSEDKGEPKTLSRMDLQDESFNSEPRLTSEGRILSAALDETNSTLNELREIDFATGKPTRILFQSRGESLVSWSADGNTVVTVLYENVKRLVQGPNDTRPQERPFSTPKRLTVWNSSTKQKISTQKLEEGWESATLSRDGRTIVSFEKGNFIVLDAMSGRELKMYSATNDGTLFDAQLSHDGKLTVIREDGARKNAVPGAAPQPGPSPTVQYVTVYDNGSGKPIKKWETKHTVNLAFAPDRLTLAVVETPVPPSGGGMPGAPGMGSPGGMAGGGGAVAPTGRLGIWDFSFSK